MTALPDASAFTAEPMSAQAMSDALVEVRNYLAGLMGTDGTTPTALAALGATAGRYEARTGTGSVVAGDRGKWLAASGTWTLTLAAAATAGAGFAVLLQNTSTGTITIDPDGAETIDGAATATLGPGRAAILMCTGTTWRTAAMPGTAAGASLAPDGTAALPGLAFAADTDTGLYRSAANTIGAATNGVARFLLGTAAFQIDLPITGTAVMTNEDDTTAGRLMDVGAFGLGGYGRDAPSTDFDLAIVSGFFKANSGTTNRPTTGSNYSLLNLPHSSTLHAQLAVCLNTGSTQINRVYIRTKSGASTWHDWEAVHTARSILGTVSQSGGVPTGAVVETGSNANGRYTRLADGTQICWISVAASAGAAVTWTFPAAFSAAPAVTGGAQATVLSCVVFDSAPTTTAVTFSSRDKTDARRADTCTLRAEGRWF